MPVTPVAQRTVSVARVLDGQALQPHAFDREQVDDRPEQVAGDVDRVGSVVDDHAAAGDARVGVPAAGHPLPAGERVLEHDRRADGTVVDHRARPGDVGHVAELRRHHQQPVGLVGSLDELAGGLDAECERLLAQDVVPAVEQVDGDLGVRRRRRADDGRIEVDGIEGPVIGEHGKVAARSHLLGHLAIGVDDRDERDVIHEVDGIDVSRGDAAGTDQRDTKRLLGHCGTPSAKSAACAAITESAM